MEFSKNARFQSIAVKNAWSSTVRLYYACAVNSGHLIRSTSEGVLMSEKPVRLGQREQQIVELLLQGCDNDEIARQLSMARRTVKAHFNRLFLRFGITSGIKRVKLATLLYRRQLCLEANVTENASPTNERAELLSLLPKDSRTRKLLTKSEPLSTSS